MYLTTVKELGTALLTKGTAFALIPNSKRRRITVPSMMCLILHRK